jgi:carboxypeptidase D
LYGGHWVIGSSDYIEKQNDKIKAGQLEDAHYIHIDTVGMINGLVDFLIQAPTFLEYAYNNTYGVQVISDAEYKAAFQFIPTCTGLLQQCVAIAEANDPGDLGNNITVSRSR